jgi:hypothetical protein
MNSQQLKLKVRKLSDKVSNIPRQIKSNANVKLINKTLNNLEGPIYPKDIIGTNLNRQRAYFGESRNKLSKSLDRLSKKLKVKEGFGRTHGGPAVNPSAARGFKEGFGRTHGGPAVNPSAARGVGGGLVKPAKEGFAPSRGGSVPAGGARVTGGSRPSGPYPSARPSAKPSSRPAGPYPSAKPKPPTKLGSGGHGIYTGGGRGPYPSPKHRTVYNNYYGSGYGGYGGYGYGGDWGWGRNWWPWAYTVPVEVPVEVRVDTPKEEPVDRQSHNQLLFILIVMVIILFMYLVMKGKAAQ